ncbi:MAG TPA: thiol reductant ABC exporter subunit CydD [Streptosporangiaceae bacterium]|nr:thiol reductant ABC exporter subunit CydD [Streptosporangiaceae bacterium]
MTRGTARAVDPRLLRHARAARGYLVVTVCIGLATAVLVLAQAGLLARALACAARGAGLASLSGTIVALLLVLTARAATAYGSESTALRAAARVKSQLRMELAERSLRLGPSWLSGQREGEISTLATKGLDALDAYFGRYLPQLVLACLVPLAVLARVMSADWISGLVILVTLPLIPVFGVLIGLYTKERTRRQWRLLARLGGHFLDVVEGLPTLKVFGRARAQAELIKSATGEHRAATMAGLRVAFLSALVLELAAALATALVAVEVGLRLLAGHIGYETALLILLLTPEAYLPLRNLGTQFHASAEGAAAADDVMAVLDAPLPVPAPSAGPSPDPRHASEPDLHSQPIELAQVTLAYPGRARPALDDVSVSISPGERIVVTGPSGAGKSSLLALLLRFTEPTSGRIHAGGRDLSSIPLSSWRRQIAWVPQSPYLFAGTVADNIALGDPDATGAQIRRAARLAGAEGFITTLADGFDTTLAERALTLSAGQRQRIALARAFLRDAPLVLLDEPTAHLDQATARQILAVVEALTAGRTVLLVSHREYGAIRPTRVLRLSQGRLVPEAHLALAGEPGVGAAVAP